MSHDPARPAAHPHAQLTTGAEHLELTPEKLHAGLHVPALASERRKAVKLHDAAAALRDALVACLAYGLRPARVPHGDFSLYAPATTDEHLRAEILQQSAAAIEAAGEADAGGERI